jgi:2',3'-cyclic-nucleotide 2'-phosphodiesterase (5'-nucleotidase family)
MRLTLLHFNDVHGRLDQFPRLFTLIDRERADARATGRHVLVLDGGDSSDRNFWESDITKGRANFALLDAMGVQASVVGNGEALQWGRTALATLVAGAHFPMLGANLVDLQDPAQPAVPGLKASHVFDLDGFKLGLVGVTAVYRSGYDRFGYQSLDPRPVLEREVAALKAQGLRFILLLSHLGYATPEEKQTWANPNDFTDDLAAQACPEIGVIVGGHSHVALETPVTEGKTVIVQAGDKGRFLGRLDVEVDEATGRVTDYAGRLIPCDEQTPVDPTVSSVLELVREEAGRLLDVPVGAAKRDLAHSIDQPSPFANLIADALRDICKADLAIFFSGFAQRGLKAGPITRRDLYEAIPGSAHVTAAQVSGGQIMRMVERMLLSPWRTESFNPHRGEPPLGLPAHSRNVRLLYDLNPKPHLLRCWVNNQPIDPARRYRLASTYVTVNDVTDDPDYDFIDLQPWQKVEMVRVEDVLWEIMEDWVKRNSPIV